MSYANNVYVNNDLTVRMTVLGHNEIRICESWAMVYCNAAIYLEKLMSEYNVMLLDYDDITVGSLDQRITDFARRAVKSLKSSNFGMDSDIGVFTWNSVSHRLRWMIDDDFVISGDVLLK